MTRCSQPRSSRRRNSPGRQPNEARRWQAGARATSPTSPTLPGYYPNQSPLHLHLACLLGGVAGIEITPETPLSYLELGCGHGFSALVLAASNPAWRVTGIDFHPAHIATARELAAEAGIANAVFIEADLATLVSDSLASDIPPADVATMHGLWSWVADPVRDGIVGLLDSKVRPGGIVQMSYNALPGWQTCDRHAAGAARGRISASRRGATGRPRRVRKLCARSPTRKQVTYAVAASSRCCWSI